MFAKRTATKRKVEESEDEQPPYKKKPKSAPKDTDSDRPGFVRNTYYYKDGNKIQYKVGDTKKVQSTVWHFCDCPNHRGKVHWHTFPADQCRTRNRWIKRQGNATANLANGGGQDDFNDHDDGKQEEDPEASETASGTADESVNSSITGGSGASSMNVQALLASALNLTQDNHVLRDAIADAINAANV